MSDADNGSKNAGEEDAKSKEIKPVDGQDISDWIKPEAPDKVRRALLLRYEGPLPPSDEFRNYEDVYPGSANRILGMAEKSLDLAENYLNVLRRRIDASTILGLAMIVLTGFLGWRGYETGVILPIGLSGVVLSLLKWIADLFTNR